MTIPSPSFFSPKNPDQIGTAIVRARHALGLSQRDLASRSKVAEQQMSWIETGRSARVRITTVNKIEDALGWPRGALRSIDEGDDAPEPIIEDEVAALRAEVADLRSRLVRLEDFVQKL